TTQGLSERSHYAYERRTRAGRAAAADRAATARLLRRGLPGDDQRQQPHLADEKHRLAPAGPDRGRPQRAPTAAGAGAGAPRRRPPLYLAPDDPRARAVGGARAAVPHRRPPAPTGYDPGPPVQGRRAAGEDSGRRLRA